jgi:NDP-sugar pyrophosphorylase family protein/aminoglycoside/choline kinase family phosphotransferase
MSNCTFNALVLAAGFGTRLRPHSHKVPKPLFEVAGRPVIDIIICRLIDAGAVKIGINVHHLSEKIKAFIKSRNYPVCIECRNEPQLLGTGGAIGNFADFLGQKPFVVINSDILTDISISDAVFQHQLKRPSATLVVHDYPKFNKVAVGEDKKIISFNAGPESRYRLMAFTGLQILDPVVYSYIKPQKFVSSIDVFSAMIEDGHKIEALEACGHYWNDLGCPESFRQSAIDILAPEIFHRQFGHKTRFNGIKCLPLAGDGSDRKWFRLVSGNKSIIAADHGIQTEKDFSEFDSFVAIGRHLFDRGAAVPEIYCHDRFSGLVFTQDLGDSLLQDIVLNSDNQNLVFDYYCSVIKNLILMHKNAKQGFDPAWAYQGALYDKKTILEKEGLYFVEAFLKNYLKMKNIDENGLVSEFGAMADVIAECGINGFMHRDLQSRNIMVTEKDFFFIDFQAGRIGPVQYDLASLLTDPYTQLDPDIGHRLFSRAADMLGLTTKAGRQNFKKGYIYCAISRNLQALGAFGYLSLVKGKTQFARYMPAALNNLELLVKKADGPFFPVLSEIVSRASKLLKNPEKSQGPGFEADGKSSNFNIN